MPVTRLIRSLLDIIAKRQADGRDLGRGWSTTEETERARGC
jgi:hypothetical protein